MRKPETHMWDLYDILWEDEYLEILPEEELLAHKLMATNMVRLQYNEDSLSLRKKTVEEIK